jgi:hypothetical protein
MTRLIQVGLVGIVGLAALITAGPTILRLVQALVPLVLVIGVMAIVLRVVWVYTRRW